MELQSLYLKKSQIEKIEWAKKLTTKTFWKRQFQVEATNRQKIFDLICGIFLPALCCFLDPIIFRSVGAGGSLFGGIRPFAYTLSFVSIMALLAFILWGEKLKWLNGFLSGLFCVGAFISFGIGILILPLSLLGLFVLSGALGFTPLLAGFVYLRNAVRAYKTSKSTVETKLLFNSIALSSILSIALPVFVNLRIDRGLETMGSGDVQTINATAQRFKYIAPLVNFDSLVRCPNRYDKADKNRKEAVERAYKELTGEDISVAALRLAN